MARKKIPWEKIREEYTSKNITLKALANNYGIAYQSIKQRSAKENWAAEKKKFTKKIKDKVKKERKKIIAKKGTGTAKTLTDIDEIAQMLLENIREGAILGVSPQAAALYAGALKDLTSVIRDVNYLPNQKDKNAHEVALAKLEIERDKLSNKTTDKEETGVLELPPVMEHE